MNDEQRAVVLFHAQPEGLGLFSHPAALSLAHVEGLLAMREFNRIVNTETAPNATLTLRYEQRQRSRLRVRLDNGDEAALVLPRGTILRGGDRLHGDDDFVVEITSAPERVSTVTCADAPALVRVAYHLGNRHVALQIEAGRVSYLHDHVLDDMVRGLGLEVITQQAAFEPEAGAYQAAGHHHHD